MDLLVALIFVVVADVLGMLVHPLLWVIVIVPALWLVSGHDRRARV